MEQTFQSKHNNIFVYLLAIILTILVSGLATYLVQDLIASKPVETSGSVEIPRALDPTKDWKVYTNSDLGFSFKYPATYALTNSEQTVSIISPLNTDRGKGHELQDGELKVEIYTENVKKDDSLDKFVSENSEIPLISESKTTIGGIQAIKRSVSGLGESEVNYLITNGKRFQIAKYPLKTSREKEYELILTSFKFDNKPVPTQKLKTYTNKNYDFSFDYPNNWSVRDETDYNSKPIVRIANESAQNLISISETAPAIGCGYVDPSSVSHMTFNVGKEALSLENFCGSESRYIFKVKTKNGTILHILVDFVKTSSETLGRDLLKSLSGLSIVLPS